MNIVSRAVKNHYLVGLLVVYILLATAYNLANPLFESPDERLHCEFIRHVQMHHRLPVVDLNGPLTENHQAPAYYVIAAILTARLPPEDLEPHTRINPFWGYQINTVGRDNKNQYLHGPSQRFPYSSRTAWSVHLTRALSTLLGVGTLVVTYRLARLFQEEGQGLATTAVVAFLPNFLLTTSSVTNDAAITLITTWAGLMMVSWLSANQLPNLRNRVLLAVLLGLGVLTKVSAGPLLPLAALTVTILAIRFRSARFFVITGLILLAGVGLIGGWWVARNLQLYGDLTGLEIMWAVWGERPPLDLPSYLSEALYFRRTFWASFGYGNVPMPAWVYVACDALAIIGIAGLLWCAVRQRKRLTSRVALLLLWVAMTLAALVWYFLRTWAVTGRQLYAVLPVIALGLVSGWSALTPTRWQRYVSGITVAVMLTFAVSSLVGVLIPAYRPSPRLSPAEAEVIVAHRLDWRLGNVARLVGYNVQPEVVAPGETLHVTLYWEPLVQPMRNYTVFIHLFGMGGERIGERDTYPGLGNDPTIYWRPGEIIVDTIPVPVSPEAEGPVALEIEAGLYSLETGQRLSVTDPAGTVIEYPIIGRVKLAQTGHSPTPTYPQLVRFADGTALVGYDLLPCPPAPGEALTVTLHWEPTGPLQSDYTVFVHLVDAGGTIVAQGDGPPRDGCYPTSLWGTDERFSDAHIIPLPGDLPPGEYALLVGLYNPTDGARLPLAAGGDTIRLDESIRIQ